MSKEREGKQKSDKKPASRTAKEKKAFKNTKRLEKDGIENASIFKKS
jgi:hypothetical protein